MQFAKRMNHFNEGIFTRLSEIKRQRLEQGLGVIDLSVGAPNTRQRNILSRLYVKRQLMCRITPMPSMTRVSC